MKKQRKKQHPKFSKKDANRLNESMVQSRKVMHHCDKEMPLISARFIANMIYQFGHKENK